MNKQIKGLLYFYYTSMRYSMIIFWSILLGILAFTLTVSYLLKNTEGVMTISMTGPIYGYVAIFGFIIVKAWIPFMIKIGATRKNIFASLAIFFTSLSIVFPLIGAAVQSAVLPLAKKFGLNVFSFLHLSYFFTDTWYTRVFIDATIIMFLFSLLFVIGLLFYKHGLAIGGTVIGSVFVLMMLGTFQGWLSDFVINLFTDISLHFFWQLALVAVVLYMLSWFFLRKITIINKR